MSAKVLHGTASIIIPCWNQLEFTRKCIAALMRWTGPNWELIVVNNGSTDPTGDYLAGVQDASAVPVTIIANATNRGFPAAINQGLHYARGEYLVMLNNDVVVTDGWLNQLVNLTAMATKDQASNPATGRESKSVRGEITNLDLKELRAENNRAPGRTGQNGERRIGLVGPMSNYAAPPQLVADVGYGSLDEMPAFARRWREEHRGKWFTVPKLSGFCLLMKRAVYDAIGGLDERFGLGLFDDDDLAERARRAGFELAVAHDLFVHHFGSRTFVGNGIDSERVFAENEKRYLAKWGETALQGRRVGLRPWKGPEAVANSGRGGQAPTSVAGASPPAADVALAAALVGPPDRARVSLTMIVRDEEENLSCCLASVRGLFDEIVVLDTGSKDRTVEVARSFGARVFDFVWVDDFAAARNAALARATGDFAFWLDADDLIEPPERRKLEALLGRLRGDEPRAEGGQAPASGVRTQRAGGALPRAEGGQAPASLAGASPPASAFVVRCACDPALDGSGGDTVVDHIRLFPVLESVRWNYRVHEQILPALKRAGVPVEWTDITIRHTGYADRALRSKKLERDLRILHEELAERPDDPFTLFNLGSIAMERGEWNDALGHLRGSLAGSAPTDSIVRKLFALIARAHQMLGDFPAALKTCDEGLAIDREDAELWYRKAVVLRQAGEPAEAERCWRRILTLSRPQKFASMHQGIYGHLTRRNLAALAVERGDIEEAKRLWRGVLDECPGDREAVERLGQFLG